MGSIFNFLGVLMKNKYFWMALGVIIMLIILRRNWYKLSRMWQPSDINFDEGETASISNERKSEIESYARMLYDSIYGSNDNDAYDVALNLTDNELKYLSKYYRKYLTQSTWLWKDIDNEWFAWWNDRDVKLQARLAKIGEKG